MIVFLVGPPGSGKTALGSKAAELMQWRFTDLNRNDPVPSCISALVSGVADSELVTLPWHPPADTAWVRLARQKGQTVGLWGHPTEMQKRSGSSVPLFTPSPHLRTAGGFGRQGTRCPEFRHLERACSELLFLKGLTEPQAIGELTQLLRELKNSGTLPPVVAEGMDRWPKCWIGRYDADESACKLLAEAMARYTLHLKARGASPRKMSAVYSDLFLAASLEFEYGAPKGKEVLESISTFVWDYEYRRKVSDSSAALARLKATLRGFADFHKADSGSH